MGTHLLCFSDLYTVISLSVPPLPQFSLSGIGLAALLAGENVNTCDAIGHSNGGVHIQNLVHHAPDMVDKIVFSHSLTSQTPDDVCTVNDTEIALYKKLKMLLKVLPASVILSAMGGTIANKLNLNAGEIYTKTMRDQCKSELKLLDKKDILTIVRCMEDFLYHHTFNSAEYKYRASRVLLLTSPTDTIVNPRQKESMRQLCPGACEYSFRAGGHTTMVGCPDEYYHVVRSFLTREV